MEIVESIESVVTILAILLGGAYAIFKLGVFRDLKPHLTITQSVSHRLVGSRYVHVAVTASLHNCSKVAIELRRALFRAQMISPLTDEDVELLYDDASVDNDDTSIWWPTLEEIDNYWDVGELIIEPHESHAQTYEFIIGSENRTILIYAYFHNPAHIENGNVAKGWEVTTVYDLGNATRSES